MKKLIIIGGYGNGTVVQSTVEDINKIKKEWELLGFLNDREKGMINGLPVLGEVSRETVEKYLKDEDVYFYYSLISVKLNHKFLFKLEDLNIPLERFATLIHPTAVVSKFAKIGRGVSIHPFVSVGPNVEMGNFIHVFAQSLVGHGAKLEDFSYVANNACIGADVVLKKGAYLGTNATTREFLTLGEWSVTGMGAVVINDVADHSTVVGNPAKEIKSKSE